MAPDCKYTRPPEVRARERQHKREDYATPEGRRKQRDRNMRSQFGITLDEYEAMRERQGNVCACCGRPEKQRNQYGPRELDVDHCHATGRVRALLCSKCNRAFGALEDDIDRVRELLKYAEAQS